MEANTPNSQRSSQGRRPPLCSRQLLVSQGPTRDKSRARIQGAPQTDEPGTEPVAYRIRGTSLNDDCGLSSCIRRTQSDYTINHVVTKAQLVPVIRMAVVTGTHPVPLAPPVCRTGRQLDTPSPGMLTVRQGPQSRPSPREARSARRPLCSRLVSA
jgi:hypothetical protein